MANEAPAIETSSASQAQDEELYPVFNKYGWRHETSEKNLVRIVKEELPVLADTLRVSKLHGGMSKLLHVGNASLIKAPKDESNIEWFEREHRIMNVLNDNGLPLMPRVEYVSPHWQFYQMTVSAGVCIGDTGISTADQKRIGSEVGDFLLNMGEILSANPVSDIIPVRPWTSTASAIFNLNYYRVQIIDEYHCGAQQYVDYIYESLHALNDMRGPEYTWMPMHCDIKSNNILVLPKDNGHVLSAMVDFGIVCQMPPDAVVYYAANKGEMPADFVEGLTSAFNRARGAQITAEMIALNRLCDKVQTKDQDGKIDAEATRQAVAQLKDMGFRP